MKRLLVTVDSLRLDHYQYMKRTQEFLGDSHPATFSTATATMGAFPQMFTGRHDVNYDMNPDESWVNNIDDPTIGITTNQLLRPEQGYSGGFDYYTSPITRGDVSMKDKIAQYISSNDLLYSLASKGWSLVTSVSPVEVGKSFRRTSDVIEELISQVNGRDDWFAWIHLMEPHHPYDPEGAGSRAESQRVSREAITENRTDNPDRVKELYRQEVIELDEQLSVLWNWADSDTDVIFTADHGEMLGENGIWGHPGNCFHPSILRIPFAHNMELPESDVRSFIDVGALMTEEEFGESKFTRDIAYASMTEITCVCDEDHIATEDSVLTLDGEESEDEELQEKLEGFRPSRITKSDGLEEDLRALGYLDG